MSPRNARANAAQLANAETDASRPLSAAEATDSSSDVGSGKTASRLWAQVFSNPVAAVRSLLLDRQCFWLLAGALAAVDAILGTFIIWKIAYTKIDWPAYMQQVEMFLAGERDYSKIEGETGPLVYPALHLYLYTALHELLPAPRERAAQYIWLGIEVATFLLAATVYYMAGRTKHIPQWLLIPLVLSKRSHSIYLLRLFNDPLAMVGVYACVILFMLHYWRIGSALFSLSLGIKMNVLLFLPGLLVLLFQYRGAMGTFDSMVIIALVQLGLGSFHFFENGHQIKTYFACAFDLSRQFLYKWTVNWRFVPEPIFLSAAFAYSLLAVHLLLLVAFGLFRWSPVSGGSPAVLRRGLYNLRSLFKPAAPLDQLPSWHIPLVLFTSNLIGMACARSLHYQFQSWYFHQIPLLLHLGGGWGQWGVIMGLPAMLEKAWDTYPATPRSSALMLTAHLVMLSGLWFMSPRPSLLNKKAE